MVGEKHKGKTKPATGSSEQGKIALSGLGVRGRKGILLLIEKKTKKNRVLQEEDLCFSGQGHQ